MAVNIGPKIGVEGEPEYRTAINNIIQQQKTLNAEMQKAAAVFNKDADAKKKSAAQMEILNKQIANQKERVSQLQTMYEKSLQKTGENSTATLKWKQALAEAETELAKMENQLQSMKGPEALADQLEASGKKLQDLGKQISGVGDTMTKTITGPLAAIGAASIKAFNDVDAGVDTLAKKTGAAGDALAEMRGIMEDLATTMPTTFENAGAAIGEVNTRFGVTGDELQELSGQFLKFAELNGTDVSNSIDTVQKMMASFGLQAEDTSAVLDLLNKVGQDTGISVDQLASSLVTNGSALRELGLNAADSARLMGELEKSGVDTSTVMSGLAKVQKTAFSEGITMSEALAKAVSSSGEAVDIFGAKAGPRLYEAFQSGILSLDMFTGGVYDLEDTLGSVSETFETTLDPMDQWQMTMNSLKVTGAEIGNALATVVAPMLRQVAELAQSAAEWFRGLDQSTQENIVRFAGLVAAVGPIVSIIGRVTTGIGGLISTGGKLITMFNAAGGAAGIMGSAIAFLTSPIGIAVAAIGGLVTAGVLLYKNWDTIKAYATQLKDNVVANFNSMKTAIANVWEGIKNTVSSGVERIKNMMNFHWSLPKLTLPHINVSWSDLGWGLRIPHLSVSWYKKAYNNPMMFTSPTIIPTASGLKGFGDGNGNEIVIGQSTLMNMMTAAVQRSGAGNTINVVVNPSAGMDEEELAELVADKINEQLTQSQEVFA